MIPIKYHPDPLATGAVVPSNATCECCGEARGYMAASAFYAEQDVETICPWCIHDRTAAEKFQGEFVDAHHLVSAGLPDDIVTEVSLRTPGYISWQGEQWLDCCNDACEFHGDAPKDEIRNLGQAGIDELSKTSGFYVDDLLDILHDYEPGGSPAFYKFVCRHCGKSKYTSDCD